MWLTTWDGGNKEWNYWWWCLLLLQNTLVYVNWTLCESQSISLFRDTKISSSFVKSIVLASIMRCFSSLSILSMMLVRVQVSCTSWAQEETNLTFWWAITSVCEWSASRRRLQGGDTLCSTTSRSYSNQTLRLCVELPSESGQRGGHSAEKNFFEEDEVTLTCRYWVCGFI